MANRKDVSTLSNTQLSQLRALLDQFIIKPNKNPGCRAQGRWNGHVLDDSRCGISCLAPALHC